MEFSVLNSLTVELEFRTSDREGIFFAISSSREQGLTLELHDGKVGKSPFCRYVLIII